MIPKPTVLLVEDNEDDAALAEMALARTGRPHTLRIARDGQQALDTLAEFQAAGTEPAVLLLDLKLPRVDGRGVLRELRGDPTTVRAPVVVLTSSRLEQDVLDSYSLGANSYFRKPVDFASFERDISVLLTHWLQLNVPPSGEEHARRVLRHASDGVDRAAQRAPEPSARDSGAQPPPILVIDENPADLGRTIEALEGVAGKGKVAGVSSVREAAALFKRMGGPPPLLAPECPSLVFIDPKLSGGHGLDLIQAIRYRGDHHLVIVPFSEDDSPAFVSECYRLKVNCFVKKPDDPVAYQDTVRLLGHYWTRINEPPPSPSIAMRAIAHPG